MTSTWQHNPVGQITGAPAAAGRITGYAWERDGTQHIVYRSADNQLHELWFRPNGGWKHGGALTQTTGAMLAAGDPLGYAWDDDDTQHIIYRGVDNQIHELWQKRGKA